MSPLCFRFAFDEMTNEWPAGFVVINKRRKPIPNRHWYHFASAFFLSDSPSGATAGGCRDWKNVRRFQGDAPDFLAHLCNTPYF
jgi:hypothetical protein